MYPSSILKNIKYQIVNRYLSGDMKILHVDSILAESATIIFPVINHIQYDEIIKIDVDGVVSIIEELSVFLKQQDKRLLKTFNRPSLYLFFLTNWSSTLSLRVKRKLCLGISLIAEVEEDGYISLKGNDKVYASIQKVGPTRDKLIYGDQNNSLIKDEKGNSLINATKIKEKEIDVTLSQKAHKTGDFFETMLTPDYTNEENQKHSKVIKRDGADDIDIRELKNKEYLLNQFWQDEVYSINYKKVMPKVWRLKISLSVYLKLKEYIKDLLSYCNSLPKIKLQDIVKRHFEKLFVFTAEWYRREYAGEKSNAFEDIHFRGKAKDIWDECPESYNKFIYKSENTSWLYSMYVLGGLPIKYRTDHFDQFYDNIISAINGEEDFFKNNIDFNNVAVRESLKENGSLYEFVEEIINGKMPFADEDLESNEIKTFVKYLKEGNERKIRNKFSLEWLIMYSEHSELMDRRLRVRMTPEENGLYHNYISYQRLETWGITNYKNTPNFKICIQFNEDDDSIVELLKFSNQFIEGFIGWTSHPYIEVDSHYIPPKFIDKVTILIKYHNGVKLEYKVVQTFSLLPYLQLYPINYPLEWSSGVCNGEITAVLYRNTLHLEGQPDTTPKQFDNTNNSDLYHWHEFTSSCTLLSEDKKSIKLSRKGDSLEIRPILYKQLIEYNANNTLDFIQKKVNGEEDKIETLVIFGREGFKVISTDVKSFTSEEINSSDYILEYKNTTDHDFTLWNVEEELKQDFYCFRVNVNETLATIHAYYIPCSKQNPVPLKRNLSSHTIEFNSQIRGLYKSKNHKLNNNKYSDKETSENKYEYKLNFFLKSSDSYLIIPVYRAWYRKELIINGRTIVISNSPSEKFDMALICKESAYVRIIDENGIHYPNNEDAGFCYFEKDVEWDAMGIEEQVKNTEHFKYIICHLYRGNGVYKISKEYQSEYVFYHWNFKKECDPKIITHTYDEKRERLTLKDEILSTPGIVFQSLLGNKKPPRYWAPYFININKTDYSNEDEGLMYKCFEIAKEHNVYFRLFQPLYALVDNKGGMVDDLLMDFFLTYAKNKEYQLTQEEYRAFHRFADEFLFDWLFLCRDLWIRKTENKEEKRVVEKLFATNPHIAKKNAFERYAYRQIIQSYWSSSYLPYNKWRVRASKNGGTALCYMHRYKRRVDHKYNFTGDKRCVTTIRCFLSSLYGEENYIQNVWNLIKEKLLKNK